MVFQDPHSSLDPRMTIGDSMAEALTVRGRLDRQQRRAEIDRLLELVSLDPAVAGGAAAATVRRPAAARLDRPGARGRTAVLIADEITSSLDVSVQGSILNVVREIRAALGLTMLFISHNVAVVRYLSDVDRRDVPRPDRRGRRHRRGDRRPATPLHQGAPRRRAGHGAGPPDAKLGRSTANRRTPTTPRPDAASIPAARSARSSTRRAPRARPDDPCVGAPTRQHRAACHFVRPAKASSPWRIRRAAGTAASSAAALLWHSRSSSSGTESATIRHPPARWPLCPMNIVRIAIAVSRLPRSRRSRRPRRRDRA